jgi:hypothetical protein
MGFKNESLIIALLATVLLCPAVSPAGETVCSYTALEHGQDYSFTVNSRPDGECKSQILNISVQHNAKLVAQLEKKSDKLTETTWVNDLDEDGRPELILISRTPASPASVTLSVFSLEGSSLKEIPVPDPPDKEGYRGGDLFSREAGKILRSYPLYRSGDKEGAPSGGKRVISYMYRNRQLLPVVQNTTADKEDTVAVKKKPGKGKAAMTVKVTAINVKADYVEIVADGGLENYKVTRIAEPWRLIVDIPSAKSAIPTSSVPIDKFGISSARIGMHKGRLRIVFDSTAAILPTETVTPVENGLRIGFYQGDK